MQNAHLFGKVYFPRMVVLVSVLLLSLITFLILFAFFLACVLYFVF